jgi:hypothetical protein
MKSAVEELLTILGSGAKQHMFKGLRESGIIFDNPSASYSIYQIRKYFHTLFGDDAADLLTNILRKTLSRTD